MSVRSGSGAWNVGQDVSAGLVRPSEKEGRRVGEWGIFETEPKKNIKKGGGMRDEIILKWHIPNVKNKKE